MKQKRYPKTKRNGHPCIYLHSIFYAHLTAELEICLAGPVAGYFNVQGTSSSNLSEDRKYRTTFRSVRCLFNRSS